MKNVKLEVNFTLIEVAKIIDKDLSGPYRVEGKIIDLMKNQK